MGEDYKIKAFFLQRLGTIFNRMVQKKNKINEFQL